MPIALFAFIAWLIIIIFSVVPKTLSVVENMIIFLCISVTEISIYTVLTLNLGIIENSKDPKMFIVLLINRDIITPILILTFINLLIFLKGGLKKLGIIVITLSFLTFMDFLTLWIGAKVYKGWNHYWDTFTSLTLIAFSTFLTKGLKSLK